MPRGYEWKAEDLATTPSQRDGFSRRQEAVWRRRYCLLLDAAAKAIPVYALAGVVATAALYLACKVEEQPKSVVTVTEAVFRQVYRRKPKALSMLSNREFAAKLKERVLLAERSLLYVLGFDFETDHPTQVALDFLQVHYNLLLPPKLRVEPAAWAEQCAAQAGPAYDLMNQLSIVVWNLCLASYQMPRFLLYGPCQVAAGAIFVAVQMMQLQPATQAGWHWWELPPLHVSFDTLEDIVGGLMEVYERQEGKPPAGAQLRQLAGQAPPGSDPHSNLSEQTAQSPRHTPKQPAAAQ